MLQPCRDGRWNLCGSVRDGPRSNRYDRVRLEEAQSTARGLHAEWSRYCDRNWWLSLLVVVVAFHAGLALTIHVAAVDDQWVWAAADDGAVEHDVLAAK